MLTKYISSLRGRNHKMTLVMLFRFNIIPLYTEPLSIHAYESNDARSVTT